MSGCEEKHPTYVHIAVRHCIIRDLNKLRVGEKTPHISTKSV